ncbi:efflux RND transporter periplasmic adaptor subunit [Mangrovibacterium diazotrophicum]|uniref:HlyD family secretion protein n=1 Tax=Mangrovibacterium diazotrophicum TaxID=1261403 RepID=A0A419VWU7_9BACT|nr:efflux RND transporter periplasmic adaptor subunit [Mangrovibacterium diazotrophicum]RKD87697.1 HlyD family secretion protein [Mangrovibacterium diazotrophicum]
MKKKLIYTIIAVVVVAIGLLAFKMFGTSEQPITIKTEKVGRSTISNTVTATGTIEATQTVEVGTQVSGRIDKIYVDYNSIVKEGQLIAVLDTQSLASSLHSAVASYNKAKAEYNYQKSTYERYQKLIDKKLIAQSDFDEVVYNYESAKASVSSAEAQYKTAKTNLDYAYIYSPIDGIVLERDVEEGETVAASYSTPTLFTIANDLTQMEIEADVDEADIGQVKLDQRVEFTVDAFPDKIFEGSVKEIHLNPTDDESVVTYTVVINAPNPDKTLMPGMTANANFYVTEKVNVLSVPNLAVEFQPNAELMAKYQEEHPEVTVEMPAPGGDMSSKTMVWVKDGNKIYPQEVTVGETDEINYEMLSGPKEGSDLIVSMATVSSGSSDAESSEARSPFMPTPPGGNKNKK